MCQFVNGRLYGNCCQSFIVRLSRRVPTIVIQAVYSTNISSLVISAWKTGNPAGVLYDQTRYLHYQKKQRCYTFYIQMCKTFFASFQANSLMITKTIQIYIYYYNQSFSFFYISLLYSMCKTYRAQNVPSTSLCRLPREDIMLFLTYSSYWKNSLSKIYIENKMLCSYYYYAARLFVLKIRFN